MKCDICKREYISTKKCLHEKAIAKGINQVCDSCCQKCPLSEIHDTGHKCKLFKESEKNDANNI